MEKLRTRSVTDLTSGVIWKQLVFFALPFLLSTVLQQFYSTADAVIVGQSVGPGALAAIGADDKLIHLLINLFVGVSTGASIAASQSFGAGNLKSLRRTIHSSMAFGLLSGGVLTILGILVSPALLRLMQTPEDVLPLAVTYISIYFLGMIPMMIYNMGSGILRAMGNSTSALYYLAFAGIINVGLDMLFVWGFHWGIAGAAAATTISQVLPAVLIFLKLTKLDPEYRLTIREIRFHKEETTYMVKVGIPTGLRLVLINIANIIVQTNINGFGLAAMAGCTLFFKVEGYLYALVSSLSLALTSFCGQNFGAKNYLRVRQGKQVCMWISSTATAVLCLLICIFAEPLCRVFTSDATAISYGAMQLRFQLPLYIIFTWNEIINGAILSSGRAIVPMTVSLLGMFVGRVGFIYAVFAFFYDIRVVYLAFPFSWIVTHIGISWYYYKGKWADGLRLRQAIEQQKA